MNQFLTALDTAYSRIPSSKFQESDVPLIFPEAFVRLAMDQPIREGDYYQSPIVRFIRCLDVMYNLRSCFEKPPAEDLGKNLLTLQRVYAFLWRAREEGGAPVEIWSQLAGELIDPTKCVYVDEVMMTTLLQDTQAFQPFSEYRAALMDLIVPLELVLTDKTTVLSLLKTLCAVDWYRAAEANNRDLLEVILGTIDGLSGIVADPHKQGSQDLVAYAYQEAFTDIALHARAYLVQTSGFMEVDRE